MTHERFLEPLDVLFLRGNRLFGDPGSFGESLLPPWPSLAAGALRSQIYAQTGRVLTDPDDFRIEAFHLAQCEEGRVAQVHAVPADLVIASDEAGQATIRALKPLEFLNGISTSYSLRQLPVLKEEKRTKPDARYWLTAQAWQRYLSGDLPGPEQLVNAGDLWQIDPRVGVGLEPQMRRADDGKLFTVQAVVFKPSIGFYVRTAGNLAPPATGVVRLGGDGRAASILAQATFVVPQPDCEAVARARRARVVLTAPGIFPQGWRLPGMQDDGTWQLGEVRARVVAAAVPRAEVVSGWDLANWQPKPAERAAPTGSVWWLEDVEASAQQLYKLVEDGLWPHAGDNPTRRAEGFNRFIFAST